MFSLLAIVAAAKAITVSQIVTAFTVGETAAKVVNCVKSK